MKETVQVFARVRPCREEGVTVSVELLDNTVVVGKHAFPFNGVFSSAATNEDVFKRMARCGEGDFGSAPEGLVKMMSHLSTASSHLLFLAGHSWKTF